MVFYVDFKVNNLKHKTNNKILSKPLKPFQGLKKSQIFGQIFDQGFWPGFFRKEAPRERGDVEELAERLVAQPDSRRSINSPVAC